MSFNDPDYPGNVLSVLISILDRDPDNANVLKDYVGQRYGNDGMNISTAPSKARKIVFSPSVFDVPEESTLDPKLVAVMMPFSPEFERVFLTIQAACTTSGLTCLRVKDIWEASAIIQDIFGLIFRANIVVCDFSGRNPNVFYEAGIAHTLGKHVIPLSQSKDDVPFDVQHHRYLPYLNNGEGMMQLEAALIRRFETLAPNVSPWAQQS